MLTGFARFHRYGLVAILAVSPVVASPAASAQYVVKIARKTDRPPVVLPPPSAPATPAPPPESKPYDPKLMRLAEILGALTYLGKICGETDADAWRARMKALLDAEGTPAVRKDRLAGAFNNGLQDYELSYRTCTANARVVIDRFLSEGRRLAVDIENRYRES